MVGRWDVTFLYSYVIGIADYLLDLFNYSPRTQNTTGDTVGEGNQSQGTRD